MRKLHNRHGISLVAGRPTRRVGRPVFSAARPEARQDLLDAGQAEVARAPRWRGDEDARAVLPAADQAGVVTPPPESQSVHRSPPTHPPRSLQSGGDTPPARSPAPAGAATGRGRGGRSPGPG